MATHGGEIMPAAHAEAITPSNSVNLDRETSGIYVGVAGNVAVVMPDDTAITFIGAAAGSIIPVRAKRVNVTNTTATDMVALYTRAR